ncbi:MAG: M24 family metallopeptidase [bacterium]
MRIDKMQAAVRNGGLDGFIISTPANTYYASGFHAITYSRPVLVLVSDRPALIIPELEETHARQRSAIQDIRTYSDMALGGLSGKSTLQLAIDLLVEVLHERELEGRRVGFEPTGFTLEGYNYLSGAWKTRLEHTKSIVEGLRMVKDDDELRLIRIGAELADVGMKVESDASVPGATEIEILAKGNAAMLIEAGKRYPELPITAGSRPVSGAKTVLPHSIPSGKPLARGDVVIHGTGCIVDGYYSEDERTIFVGDPTAEQRKLFNIMLNAQQSAIDAIRPGVPCKNVDRAARSVIEDAGYGKAFMHRTGHGIGIDIHELPFFAASDDTVLEPGMVMSVEPGIYVEGLGGFRHSDTIIVTEDGCNVLTKYPKALAELIFT